MSEELDPLRRAFFVPCETQEDLRDWIDVYLGIYLPDTLVEPVSTASPMSALWTVYNALRTRKFRLPEAALYADLVELMVYASRESYKTLMSAILEVLVILHLDLDVCHIAAIERQSKKCQGYVKDFFAKPYLRDYVVSQNESHVRVAKYTHRETGQILSEREFKALTVPERGPYGKATAAVEIVVCTVQGVNGPHSVLVVLDELDVITGNKIRAYEEAKMIPGARDGVSPITMYISTRKFSFGLVQAALDDAAQTGLKALHWNVVDVVQPCPPERHRPGEPKVMLRLVEPKGTVRGHHVTEEAWEKLQEDQKPRYTQVEGYAGCATCKLFFACRGNLVKQAGKSPMLKGIDDVIGVFRKVSPGRANAQLLCNKPSEEGLVYPFLERDVHMVSAAEMAEMIDGEPHPGITKLQLIALMRDRGMDFYAGLDHGHTHNFAVASGAKDGARMFVFDCQSAAELELDHKVALMEATVRAWDPKIYPDTSEPGSNKTIARKGFKIQKWSKGPDTVHLGIETVRTKLHPAVGEPQLFFLEGDEGCELLFLRLSKYHWKLDEAGRSLPEPDKVDDDECFTAATEALTKRGWVSLKDVTEADEVMAVQEDGRGQWERPIGLVRKTYSGGMISIKDHNHLEFEATEGHLHAVMTQMDWRVKKRYKIQKLAVADMFGEMYWANNLSSWPEGPGYFQQGCDEAWFAGFWLAEGCFDTGRPTFLIVDQTKVQQQDELREVASRLGWTWSETQGAWSETQKGNAVRFVFSGQGPRAAAWRASFGSGAVHKRLPVEIIAAMSAPERRALWEGYMQGDGCRTGSDWHFDSVSDGLIGDIQVLTLSLGYGCHTISYACMAAGRKMTSPVNGRQYNSLKLWRAHVLRKKPVAHVKKSRFSRTEVSGIEVYCVQTSTGAFLARTNGKPFVAGNCDALRYLVMNVYPVKGRVTVAAEKEVTGAVQSLRPLPTQQTYLSTFIQQALGEQPTEVGQVASVGEGSRGGRGKTGRFTWDI